MYRYMYICICIYMYIYTCIRIFTLHNAQSKAYCTACEACAGGGHVAAGQAPPDCPAPPAD